MDNFQSLLRNYDFQSEDIARLKSIHSLAEDSLEAFLTLFYSRIFSFRHANQFLSHKNIIEMHRQKIKIWILELFGGIYDDEYFEKYYYTYPEIVQEKMREAVKQLKIAAVFAQRVDWFLSGDDGEESFIERLAEDLNAL